MTGPSQNLQTEGDARPHHLSSYKVFSSIISRLVTNMTVIPAEKRCTKCGKVKPVNDFYAAKGGLAGRRPECKRCGNAYHQVWARERYVPRSGRRYDIGPENRARNLEKRLRRGELRRRLDEEARGGEGVPVVRGGEGAGELQAGEGGAAALRRHL